MTEHAQIGGSREAGGATSAKLLSPEQVSDITGLSVETLAQWRSQRKGIPFLKLSRNVVRYRQSDLDAWLSERAVPVASGSGRTK